MWGRSARYLRKLQLRVEAELGPDDERPTPGDLVRIGGSNAQREVFEDTLLQAYLRAGRFAEAEVLLRKRVGRRHSARDFFWLGSADTTARLWEPDGPKD